MRVCVCLCVYLHLCDAVHTNAFEQKVGGGGFKTKKGTLQLENKRRCMSNVLWSCRPFSLQGQKKIHRIMPCPSVTFSNGNQIPAVGLGTWQCKPNEVHNAVVDAITNGYRHIDCAMAYQNEEEIGTALKAVIGTVVKREELFITSKLWNTLVGFWVSVPLPFFCFVC